MVKRVSTIINEQIWHCRHWLGKYEDNYLAKTSKERPFVTYLVDKKEILVINRGTSIPSNYKALTADGSKKICLVWWTLLATFAMAVGYYTKSFFFLK